MINCFMKYAPDIYDNCKLTLEKTFNNNDVNQKIINLNPDPFINCSSISIDYAIMEKLINDNEKNIKGITILYKGHWNDIGSYLALYSEIEKIIIKMLLLGMKIIIIIFLH